MTMRLKEIRIYGYGKFQDYALTNIRPFQVIYGENEAGKSTILSFIQSVLFGFPPVRQTNECRYEPKTGAKYGGALVLEVPGKGEVRIERIRGKSQGDVTVLFEDGTRGGEEALAELLSGIDKPLFQSVYFSISIIWRICIKSAEMIWGVSFFHRRRRLGQDPRGGKIFGAGSGKMV
jgi:hypothetical protein